MFIASRFFEYATLSIGEAVSDISGLHIYHQAQRLLGSQFQQLTNANIYIVMFSTAAVSLVSIFQILRKRTMGGHQAAFWFSLLGALLIPMLLLPYGEETPFRAFMFGLPFFSLLSVHLLKRKPKILLSFLLLMVIVCIPALYGSDSYRLATAPELLGGKFCATYLPDRAICLYKGSPYVRYYNPLKTLTFQTLGGPPFLSFDPSDIESTINNTDYVILSRNQENYYTYYLGSNPFDRIPFIEKPNVTQGKIYDNGNFSIFYTGHLVP
jgi:hypothetical protein